MLIDGRIRILRFILVEHTLKPIKDRMIYLYTNIEIYNIDKTHHVNYQFYLHGLCILNLLKRCDNIIFYYIIVFT